MGNLGRLLFLTVLPASGPLAYGQQSIFGTNLIVNGNAEAGPAGTDLKTPVSIIPGSTVFGGKPTVMPNFPSGTLVTAQNALTTKLEVLFGSTPAAISRRSD